MQIPAIAPEPASDIAAQVRALLDPEHPKDAVFVAAGNMAALLPVLDLVQAAPNAQMVHHPSGTLLTTNSEKAVDFARPGSDDDTVAAILGYPEPKSSLLAAMMTGEVCVVQARDADGNVVVEALASNARKDERHGLSSNRCHLAARF
jgi:hypothetical protein